MAELTPPAAPVPLLFPWGDMPEEEYFKSKKLKNEREWVKTPRGISVFTQSWVPLEHPPEALIFMVHGYGNDSSWIFQNTAILFTQMGYATVALDLEGHGQSDGLKGFLPNLDNVVLDCSLVFNRVKQRPEFQKLPCFLYGESLGGAICLLLHFQEPQNYDGAILMAPMCKISEKMEPPWPVRQILTFIAHWFPTWPIVPTKDLVDQSVKDPVKREIARNNPRRYAGKPRLGTVLELLRVTARLSEKLKDVSFPFLVIHGDADVVTDPAVSKFLYENASSEDKTLKLYEGMQHSLIQGETDDNVAIILSDLRAWLKVHVEQKAVLSGNKNSD
jgi:acylglycerol lipase